MIILGNLLLGVAQILGMLLQFIVILVVIRAIASWLNPDPYNPIVRFLNDSTEPLLRPIRRYIPSFGMLDLSPLLLILVLMFLQTFLVGTLQDYGLQIKLSSQ